MIFKALAVVGRIILIIVVIGFFISGFFIDATRSRERKD